jgi:hypothetical protein
VLDVENLERRDGHGLHHPFETHRAAEA